MHCCFPYLTMGEASGTILLDDLVFEISHTVSPSLTTIHSWTAFFPPVILPAEDSPLLLHSQCRPHLPLLLYRVDFPFQVSNRPFLVRFDLLLGAFDPCQRPVDPPELDLIEKPLEPGGPLTGLCLCQLAEETDLILLLRFELLQNDPGPFQMEARGCETALQIIHV